MSDRTFGVEIECTVFGNGVDSYDTCGDCECHCGECCECGLDHEGSIGEVCSMLRRAGFPRWADDVIYDGSQFEIKSPILRGPEGFDELRRVMSFLSDKGAYCTDEDGLHIHHGADDYAGDKDMILRLIDSWVANEENIEHFVDSGRIDSWACHRTFDNVRARELKQAIKADPTWADYYSYERGALNVDALRRHGTIEFRLMEGTLDFSVAESWIRFGQRLLDHVALSTNAMRGSTSSHALLKRIGLDPTHQARLLAKAATA